MLRIVSTILFALFDSDPMLIPAMEAMPAKPPIEADVADPTSVTERMDVDLYFSVIKKDMDMYETKKDINETAINKRNLSLIIKYKSKIFIEIMFLLSIAINNYDYSLNPSFLNHDLSFHDTFL